MLYDPKWEKQIKADPYSLASLIAWLEQQPATAHYNILCPGQCLLGQFARYNGESLVSSKSNDLSMDDIFLKIAFGNTGTSGPHTYGAALERARSAAAR